MIGDYRTLSLALEDRLSDRSHKLLYRPLGPAHVSGEEKKENDEHMIIVICIKYCYIVTLWDFEGLTMHARIHLV